MAKAHLRGKVVKTPKRFRVEGSLQAQDLGSPLQHELCHRRCHPLLDDPLPVQPLQRMPRDEQISREKRRPACLFAQLLAGPQR